MLCLLTYELILNCEIATIIGKGLLGFLFWLEVLGTVNDQYSILRHYCRIALIYDWILEYS